MTKHDRAILDLKIQRDRLRQYQKRIEAVRQREAEVARECLRRGDKAKALLAIKKRKLQESMLTKADAQLINLENMVGVRR